MRTKKFPIEPLLPVIIPSGKIRYAPGIRAGRWIFATGHKGTADFVSGIAPEILAPRHPRCDRPKHKKEAEVIFRNFARVLKAGGGDPRNVVRIDQYYTTWKAVDPYHEVRRAFFKGHIPPSTSNLHQRFLLADQDIEVQMIAAVPGKGFRVEQVRPVELKVHPTSGYSPALKAGDFVFVAGQTAEALDTNQGPIDPEARIPAGHLWKGTAIKLETEFIIRRKMEPALKAVGSSLKNVVKSQVYLRDPDDIPAFMEVWGKYFPLQPATTVITTATPGFICEVGRIEINTIALTDHGKSRKQVVKADVATPYRSQTLAVRAGDLLFLSGLMAVDEGGAIAGAEPDPRQPFFGSSIQTQMEFILANAEKICRAAGTTLANAVRIQQFHTDLNDFYPAYRVWQGTLPGQPLPFSAIEIPKPFPVPGLSVLLDLWVYCP